MRGWGRGGEPWESWEQGTETKADEAARLWKEGRREVRSEGNLRDGGGWIAVAEGDSERLNCARETWDQKPDGVNEARDLLHRSH